MQYTCPMHPGVKQEKPGMCPECGMNLVAIQEESRHSHQMHDKHEGHKTESFLNKFWVSLTLTIPIFFYSEMASMIFKIEAPKFLGYQYVFLVLGTIVYFYCGWIFIISSYRELKAKFPGMMTLIAIAITTAYFYSLFSVLLGTGHDLLFELSSLITIMLLGHFIEMKSVKSAKGSLNELAKLLPDTAELIEGNSTKIIPVANLQIGDLVLVKPGSKIPADGNIISGNSEINESIITGESKPILKKEGDEVIAGSINGDGILKVQVLKIGEGTFLSGVARLVRDAEASKSKLQMLSDKAAFYLTIIAIGSALVTFLAWMLAKAGWSFALERTVAVLVIACPHALGLAIPLVASISTTMAARSGFLIKQRIALENARKIEVVLFDKTGTLTKGEFEVDAVLAAKDKIENEVLLLAASLNKNSEHPLAKAMVKESEKRNLGLIKVENVQRLPEGGLKGFIDGKEIIIGSERLLEFKNIILQGELALKAKEFSGQGKTMTYIFYGEEFFGCIALADAIREESIEAVTSLRKLGVRVAMITGDSEDVAKWVAKDLGIDEYFAKVLPKEKSEKVKLLQSKGYKVAMVGDGVNDAPALAQADLGIAIGAGTNVAIESAGIILVKNNPKDIAKIIKLSKLTYSKMIQNLFWATGYNIIALPLAAGVLASKGIILQPALAAVFMSLSTVIVALNAVLLRNKKI